MYEYKFEKIIVALEKESLDYVEILWDLGEEYDFYSEYNFDRFKEKIEKLSPSIILINIDIAKEKAIDLIKKYKGNNSMSIIAVSENEENEEKFLKLGVNDFIVKPYKSYLVKLRLDTQLKLISYIKEIENLSMTDKLTSLPNRRRFDQYYEQKILDAIRNHTKIAILMADIDKFKRFNDTYGHQTGDLVLQEVAKVFSNNIRSNDFLSRWGGEEFVFILSDTNEEGAIKVAENLRKAIENNILKTEQYGDLKITVSIGIGCDYFKNLDQSEVLLKTADDALYKAKENGRNRVELFK